MFIIEASMLKTLITLVRGRTALITKEVADQNALLILDQQMRDVTGALDRAKKALAVASRRNTRRASGSMRPTPGSRIWKRGPLPRSRPDATTWPRRPPRPSRP